MDQIFAEHKEQEDLKRREKEYLFAYLSLLMFKGGSNPCESAWQTICDFEQRYEGLLDIRGLEKKAKALSIVS